MLDTGPLQDYIETNPMLIRQGFVAPLVEQRLSTLFLGLRLGDSISAQLRKDNFYTPLRIKETQNRQYLEMWQDKILSTMPWVETQNPFLFQEDPKKLFNDRKQEYEKFCCGKGLTEDIFEAILEKDLQRAIGNLEPETVLDDLMIKNKYTTPLLRILTCGIIFGCTEQVKTWIDFYFKEHPTYFQIVDLVFNFGLISACRIGAYQTVDMLIKDLEITFTAKALIAGIDTVCKYKHLECFKVILKLYSKEIGPISEKTYIMLKSAGFDGDLPSLSFFLDHDKLIFTNEQIRALIEESFLRPRMEVLNFLLENSHTRGVFETNKQNLYCDAKEKNCPQEFLEKIQLSLGVQVPNRRSALCILS